MASRAKIDRRSKPPRDGWGALLSGTMFLAVWLPIGLFSLLHYGTSHEYHWVHDVLRRAYYLPIVVAALRLGLRGGLGSAFVVTLCYLPHAFLAQHHFDPARSIEKALEILLYFTVGAVAGYLSGLERRRRTELQASLVEQQRLTEQLVHAGKLSAIGEVVAGIAHEIKTPLHSLAGTAEIIDPLVAEDSDERRMWLIHRDELRRLKEVAERFLSFARPAPIDPVPLDLRDVARRTIDLVAAEARQKNIQIETQLDHQVMVQGDLDQLVQVGLNIAVNGIKAHGGEPGSLNISVERSRGESAPEAALSITNDGPAIPEDELSHLFDPFHSSGEGTGLGLSISARIAEQHSGRIEAVNTEAGVSFTLVLPIHE